MTEAIYTVKNLSPQLGHKPVDKYYVMNEESRAWGFFYIDEQAGTFMAFTDFGEWAHGWQSHGCESLKHFLVEILDKPYCIEKLSRGKREFDVDKTKRNILEDIFKARREHSINKDSARQLYDDLDGLFSDFGYSDSLSGFEVAAYQLFDIHTIYPDYDMPIARRLPNSLVIAQKELFLPLKNLLKKELDGAKDPIPDGS